MADDTVRVLLCFIEADSTVSMVTAPVDADIAQLKQLVWEKEMHDMPARICAKDLVLWKVSPSHSRRA